MPLSPTWLDEEGQQLLLGVVALDDGVADVGPVEARRKHPRSLEAEPLDDVGAGDGIGGGGERNARHAGKQLGDAGEIAIFRAEVVAPLADAMRLVDGEQGDPRVRQHLAEARRRQPFGSDIEQVELAARQRAPDGSGVFGAQRRIQRRGADAGLAQRLDLVAHQRDQRRNDDADARPADRRDLVAGGLAGAGRKQHHRIAAIADVAHHVFLLAPESSVPEDLAQHVERVPDGLGLQQVQMQVVRTSDGQTVNRDRPQA